MSWLFVFCVLQVWATLLHPFSQLVNLVYHFGTQALKSYQLYSLNSKHLENLYPTGLHAGEPCIHAASGDGGSGTVSKVVEVDPCLSFVGVVSVAGVSETLPK